jgi:hypothetical protein
MTKLVRILSILLAAASLAACATVQRIDAAGDVHALLISIRDDDRATFEDHIDRRALEAQLQDRMVGRARKAGLSGGWKAAAVLLSGPLSRVGGDILIKPDVFRAVADYYGYGPERPIPGVLALSTVLRNLPDGRVCAAKRKAANCLLTFADEDGTWRLVSFDGDAAMLRIRGR